MEKVATPAPVSVGLKCSQCQSGTGKYRCIPCIDKLIKREINLEDQLREAIDHLVAILGLPALDANQKLKAERTARNWLYSIGEI